MKIIKIPASEQIVSRWSGGTTTQLAIFPPEAIYADRDFLWRISSAVVELPESDFTPLPDYDRILMILKGELDLSHDGGEEYTLRAWEQTSFNGASHTFSRGQVTDFNLMMRKGRCTGRVEARVLNTDENWTDALSESFDNHLFFCAEGTIELLCGDATVHLETGEALLVQNDGAERCTLRGNAAMVLAEVKVL